MAPLLAIGQPAALGAGKGVASAPNAQLLL